MTTKHTPGPWRLQTKGNMGNVIEAYGGKHNFEGDDGFRAVAMFQCCEPTGLHHAEEENKLANARLIAAAPDLLAALEDVTAELSQLHSHYHPACEGGCPTVEYIMNARKAILKSNGG